MCYKQRSHQGLCPLGTSNYQHWQNQLSLPEDKSFFQVQMYACSQRGAEHCTVQAFRVIPSLLGEQGPCHSQMLGVSNCVQLPWALSINIQHTEYEKSGLFR